MVESEVLREEGAAERGREGEVEGTEFEGEFDFCRVCVRDCVFIEAPGVFMVGRRCRFRLALCVCVCVCALISMVCV